MSSALYCTQQGTVQNTYTHTILVLLLLPLLLLLCMSFSPSPPFHSFSLHARLTISSSDLSMSVIPGKKYGSRGNEQARKECVHTSDKC